jgi:hypothetical protein
MRRWIALLLVSSPIAFAATGRDRSDAVYPQQHIPLKFSHQQHFEEGAACTACHDPARTSVKASDVLLPRAVIEDGKITHPDCESCHDIDTACPDGDCSKGKPVDPKSTCDVCHIGWEQAAPKRVEKPSFPAANLVFNHQNHIDRLLTPIKAANPKADANNVCQTCHFSAATGSMDDVGLSTRFQLPKMETCLNCHNGSSASAECRTCHLTDPSGRLQLTFASVSLRPMQGDPLGLDHGPRYEFTHSTRAKIDRRTCNDCHKDDFCMSCHDALQKPLSVHPNDWITLHAAAAHMDTMNCQACHRYQSFCAACHERVGIGFNSDPTLRARNLSVHGDYQTWVNIAGPGHHAIAAARDIQNCISCHREETCTACHATTKVNPGSRGVNPHAPGFKSICHTLATANNRACLKCHQDAELKMLGCEP